MEQVNKAGFFMIALVLLSGCAVSPVAKSVIDDQDRWVQPSGGFGPSSKNQVSTTKYSKVQDDELPEALDSLKTVDVVSLSRQALDKSYPGTAKHLPQASEYYLVRAPYHEGNGIYTAYYKSGQLLILYNNMGGCGAAQKSAFIFALDAPVVDLFGGCSGAM